MVISTKRCRNCGRNYQYYKGAALPASGLCSQCVLGQVVLSAHDFEDEKQPTQTHLT